MPVLSVLFCKTKRIVVFVAINLTITVLLLECSLRLAPIFLPDGYLKEVVLFSARHAKSDDRIYPHLSEFLNVFHNSTRIRLPQKEKKDLLFVGDSFTFGAFIENQNIFPTLVGKSTGKRTANLGVGGVGPQTYNRMIEVGMRYDPDVIIYCINLGDLMDAIFFYRYYQNRGPLSLGYTYQPMPLDDYFFTETISAEQQFVSLFKTVANHSRTYLLAKQIIAMTFRPLKNLDTQLMAVKVHGQSIYVSPRLIEHCKGLDIKAGIDLTCDLIERAHDFCDDNRKAFVLALIPAKEQIYDDWYDPSGVPNPYIEIKSRLAQRHVPIFDATDCFKEKDTLLYFTVDGHFNESGHKFFAEGLVEYLCRHSFL